MTIADFNHFNSKKKKDLLEQCCGSSAWVNEMLTVFPVSDLLELLEHAQKKWYDCTEADWLQAFEQHPKIGDLSSLKKKFENTKALASGEQSGVSEASEKVLTDLAKRNDEYEKKFGYIFIVCATGKSAEEMLTILNSRLQNTINDEKEIAAEEQNKITKLRLQKLFS